MERPLWRCARAADTTENTAFEHAVSRADRLSTEQFLGDMLEWLARCTPCSWNTAFEVAAFTVGGRKPSEERFGTSCLGAWVANGMV